jgi:hypothetical protein
MNSTFGLSMKSCTICNKIHRNRVTNLCNECKPIIQYPLCTLCNEKKVYSKTHSICRTCFLSSKGTIINGLPKEYLFIN